MRSTLWVVLILSVALGCLSTGVSRASDARIDALAVQQEYLEDYFLFRVFPTVAARYQNLVTASLGGRTESGSFLDDKSVGVIGAGDNTSYGTFALYLNQLGSDTNTNEAQFDITWAKQFESIALGLGFLYTSSSFEQGLEKRTPFTGFPGMNELALTGGAKFDLDRTGLLELAARLSWLSWEERNGAGTILTEDAGNMSYSLAGRIMSDVTDRTTLVPVASYRRMDVTPEGDDDDTFTNNLNLGVALHHEVNGNDMLIVGVAANYLKMQTLDVLTSSPIEETHWDLPALFVALEFDVYSWLTTRVGATKTVDLGNVQIDETGATPDVETRRSRYFFGLGMGLHFDHFDVDATVNPDAVFSGGYLFSGEDTTPLTRITATYYF